VSVFIAVLNALIAIPKIAGIVEQLCSAVSAWWISRQNEETYAKIIDAAALAARAKTQEERFIAADTWRAVLSRPRIVQK
jgi:hypothetical protein